MENNLRKLIKKIERYPTVKSKVVDLLSRYSGRGGGRASPDVVSVGVAIPRYSVENNLRKLLKKILSDPTVDLLSRYSGRGGGRASPDVVSLGVAIPRYSVENSLRNSSKKIYAVQRWTF